MNKKRILFAAHPTEGHTSAIRAIGRRLSADGHCIGIAVPTIRLPFAGRFPEPLKSALMLAGRLKENGFDVLPLHMPLSAFWHGARLAKAKGQEELGIALRIFTAGIVSHARKIADHIRKWEADVIVGDYLMPAAILGAKLAGRPFAAIYHSALPFPVKDAPPFGSCLDGSSKDSPEWKEAEDAFDNLVRFADLKIEQAAKTLGIDFECGSLLTRPMSGELNILATAPELEPGLLPIEGPVVMTGPCLPSVSACDPRDPALSVIKSGMPHVYVSLGTVFNGQPRIFAHILEGLSRVDVQVIVSAGSSVSHLLRFSSEKIHIFERVPQVPLLCRVDAVITHGGNNTVQETIAAGKPMVVIPFGGDQIVNAKRVERLGIGESIMPERLSPDRVFTAVQNVMKTDRAERAKKLGESLKDYKGTETAVEKILELAAKSR